MITDNEISIPGYVIEGKLGEGGMGVIYKARQLSLNREVAIKVLSEKLSTDPRFVARFQREAKLSAQLNHKNIVSILETGVLGNSHYYVMELVEGASLEEILQGKRVFPEHEILKIVEEVTEALQHAYKHNVIHRDIKPANIMISGDGHVKLCDLGIAKQTQGDLANTLTMADAIIGTPLYISPEQLTGKKLDIRSDIYSLGVTLYHMITLKLPFRGKTILESAFKRLQKDAAPPKQVNPNISDDINNLILKMMARNRNDRYTDPTELLKDIRRIKQGEHISTGDIRATSEIKRLSSIVKNVEGLLGEKKFAAAIKEVKSFRATGEETKARVTELIKKINDSAEMEIAVIKEELDVLIAKGQLDDAVKVIKKAQSLYEAADPDLPLVTAITQMKEKVEDIKSKTIQLLQSANSRCNQGDFKKAISDCDKLINMNPKYARAYELRGMAKSSLGDYRGTLEDYEMAIELNPSYHRKLENLIAYAKSKIIKK